MKRLLCVTIAVAACGVSAYDHNPPDDPPVTTDPAPAATTPAPTATPSRPSPDAAVEPRDGAPRATVDARAPDAVAAVGPGVTIAGAFVPREKALVFLHIGHSNMAGRATGPAALKPFFYDTDPRLWAYAKGGVWRPAKEPLSPDSGTGSAAGPGMAILRTGMSLAPRDAYFISIGHGHSGTEGGTCVGFRKGGLLYDIVMKPALELRGKVTYAGIWTMLGITENHFDAATNSKFADCMAGIAADMRGDLGEPDLPFVVGDFERGETSTKITPDFRALIIAQLAMVPGKVSRSVLIPTDGLPMQDDHHYDMMGHKLWAERGFALLTQHQWLPW